MRLDSIQRVHLPFILRCCIVMQLRCHYQLDSSALIESIVHDIIVACQGV